MTASSSSPPSPPRGGHDSGLDLDAVAPERTAVSLGSAVGGTMRLEDEYVAVSDPRRDWLVDPGYAPHSCTRPRSEQPRQRVGAAVPRARALGRRVHRLHFRHRRDRLRPPADPGRRRRRRDLRCHRVAHLADLDGLLRPDQGHLAAKRRPRARLAAVRSRPRGFVMGEGGAVLILEEYEHARAPWRAHLLRGRGLRDPRQRLPHDGPAHRGVAMTEAINDAMRQNGTKPEDFDYVNAHGSGTKQNDRHETRPSRTVSASTPTTSRSARSSR